jgi:ubiquinone/menaquinone biosynthesis C-methylase UbiE
MTNRTANIATQVRRLFDAKAAAWPSKYTPDGRLVGRLTRLSGAVAYGVPAGGSVLDLGCGTGELAGAIAAAGMQVTGCDISREMLRRAAAADPAHTVGWVQLDPGWRRLPFEPETFDAVVAASVLEYVDEPTAVLRECSRVLRPGGSMLCTVPDPHHPIRWLEWLLGVAARVPLVRAACNRWPRLDSYQTYLRISRQRHSSRWWRTAAARADLFTAPGMADTADTAVPSPLRLLTFQRLADSAENS